MDLTPAETASQPITEPEAHVEHCTAPDCCLAPYVARIRAYEAEIARLRNTLRGVNAVLWRAQASPSGH